MMNSQSYKEDFIKFMVKSGVLTFGDFVTKSGRNTPYFINTGNYKTGAQAARLGYYYASSIKENFGDDFDVLFGPAYKGIPLAVSCSVALSEKFSRDVFYTFNRKEAKDHGEGGVLIGHQIKKGDRVLIIEDVITAGTAIRECLPLLEHVGAEIAGLVVSVDRMERGKGSKSAIQEVKEDYGIVTKPIVTVRDIIETLHNKPLDELDGQVIVDDEMRAKMEAYLAEYGI